MKRVIIVMSISITFCLEGYFFSKEYKEYQTLKKQLQESEINKAHVIEHGLSREMAKEANESLCNFQDMTKKNQFNHLKEVIKDIDSRYMLEPDKINKLVDSESQLKIYIALKNLTTGKVLIKKEEKRVFFGTVTFKERKKGYKI